MRERLISEAEKGFYRYGRGIIMAVSSGVLYRQGGNTGVATEIINKVLSMDIPDDFQQMSPEELKKVYLKGRPNCWGTWDKEQHVMMAVSWERYPGILSALADIKELVQWNRMQTEKAYMQYDYKKEGYFSMRAGDVPLEGHSFSFRKDGTVLSGETVLLKYQKTVYAITCTGREENKDTNRAMFRKIIENLRMI